MESIILYNNMLLVLLLLPLVGSVLLSVINTRSESEVKQIALGTSLVTFFVSIVIYVGFDNTITTYQYTQEFNSVNFCHLSIGIDGISLYYVILTTFLTPICILSNWKNISQSHPQTIKSYLISFLILESILIAVFIVLDLLLFYIFFESVLIPLFIIIGIWGGSQIKVRAAYLFFIYTLFGSLFILLAVVTIYSTVGSTDYNVISLCDLNLESQKILWLAVFISIAIKTPFIPFNTWLTYAHSEAPIGGSIILAGVILKLASYGYLRIQVSFLPDACNYYSPLVQTICVITIIYASLVTLRQTDFKKLIAYSSVAHAATIALGVFSNTIQGIEGAILLGIGHGLVSPALFYLVGGVLYDRFHTRTIRYYRGIVIYIPLFSVLFFIFSISNAGVPLTINWVGEYLSLTGIYQINPLVAFLASSGIVLSASYCIWLFNRISFGSYSKYLGYTIDINRRESIILFPLLFLTFLFGLYPNLILDNLHSSVATLIYTTPLPSIINYIIPQAYFFSTLILYVLWTRPGRILNQF